MKNNKKPSIVIVSGPTAIGKTSVSIKLAQYFGGEIIGADAMQVYKYLNIGTAKPTEDEISKCKHHLIDVVEPDEEFNASIYKKKASKVIEDLYNKNISPFVVGGTGLYIKALTKGLFLEGSRNNEIAEKFDKELRDFGKVYLFEKLKKIDPDSAKRIHINDVYRIKRALEVYESTGETITDLQKSHNFGDTFYNTFKIALTMDREKLYERINFRVDLMIKQGLLDEVKRLLNSGYSSSLKSMQSIGYKHMCDFVEGRSSWDDAVETLKRDTRRYAKRQFTWFRKDSEFIWIEPDKIDSLLPQIKEFFGKGS